MKKYVLILFLICIFLSGCGTKESTDFSSKMDEIRELMEQNEFVILDVRTQSEYEESHLKGAISLPYDEITEERVPDKSKLYFVYCKSGNRSKIAYNTLKKLGYFVYDMGAFSAIDLPKE